MAQTKLKLPLWDTLKYYAKYAWIVLLIVGAILVGIFLLAGGSSGVSAFKRCLLKLALKRKDLEYQNLELQETYNYAKIQEDEILRREVEAKRKQLEKERQEALSKLVEKSNADTVNTLRDRGF